MSISFAGRVRALASVAALATLCSVCFAAGLDEPGAAEAAGRQRQPTSPPQGQARARDQGQPQGQIRGQAGAGAADAHASQGQQGTGEKSAQASHGPPRVCVVIETGDPLTQAFADRVRQLIGASGALSLATGNDACDLRLHVPGNLLRFETAGGVMVSTVVIVTAPSGRYLSTSISACQANVLKPCALRAVNVAKLALVLAAHDESAGGSE